MKTFRIFIIGLIFFSGCRAFNESSDQPKLGDGQWQLLAMDQKASDLGDKAFIKFDEKEQKMSGKAACNSIFAEYELLPRNKIRFGNIGSTKMYCEGLMGDENQIVTDLQKVRSYEIKYGLLYLHGSDNELLLSFKKVDTDN
jgi:heat shock protein HslJ